eukprot:Skav216201  [mRNA]  locus=scaffold238:72487:74912:- [translate_table: standard]
MVATSAALLGGQDLDPEVSKITKQFFSCVQVPWESPPGRLRQRRSQELEKPAVDRRIKLVDSHRARRPTELLKRPGEKPSTLDPGMTGSSAPLARFLELSDLGRHAAATVKAPELPTISPEARAARAARATRAQLW